MTNATLTLDDTRVRAVLEEQLAVQRAVLHEYTVALDESHHRDVDTDDRVYIVASLECVTDVVADIEAALARLDDATYGVCERCDEAIAPARLEALPTARRCVRCAAR